MRILPLFRIVLGSTILLSGSACFGQTGSSGATHPLDALHFLLGTWKAATEGSGTAGATVVGTYTFQQDLSGHVLTRSSSQDTCKGPQTFDCQHHDQLTIFVDPSAPGSLSALYLDSEGHVIHYLVTTPDPQTAVFQSVPMPGAPGFRLTYHLQGSGPQAVMTGSFEGAAPGSTAYHPYLRWSGTQR